MSRAYIYLRPPEASDLVTLGRLEVRGGQGEFVYHPDYVRRNGWVPDAIRYPLRPQPYSGIRSNGGLPGFIRDAAPDGWGQKVLAYAARQELSGIDYLVQSSNADRSGSLLIGTTRTPSSSGHLDRLDRLEDFIAFAAGIQSGDRLALTLQRAIRQRTSLGGVRPKVSLWEEGRLVLAKPRDRHDLEDIPAFEHACMTFAAGKGMQVARTRLYRGSVSVLLVDRFDRVASAHGELLRLPMLSGATLLDLDWRALPGGRWRYAELADEMRRRGVPLGDLQELYRRMCFNALVGNDDDHPKNHAVIFTAGCWRLSPMFDVVPALDGMPPPSLAMEVGRLGRAITRDNLLSHAGHFGHTREGAAAVLDEVAGWAEELCAHYRDLLTAEQAARVIRAMDATRLQA